MKSRTSVWPRVIAIFCVSIALLPSLANAQDPQTITFSNPGAQNFGTTPTLTATSSAGAALMPTFTSSTTGVCTITSGGTLTFVAAGTCTINADQSGDDDYAAAATVSRTFTVNAVVPGTPTGVTATAGDTQASIAFTAPSFTGGTAITGYTVTTNPADVAPINGAASPIVISGLTNGQAYTFTVTANNSAGTGPASPASNAVTPAAVQNITFNNPNAQNFGTTPTLTATTDSGLTPTFSSSTPGVCTITSAGALTFVTAGTCTINADQAGNGSYLPAPQISRSFTVNPVVPGAPTAVVATPTEGQASVAFAAPAFTGGIAITGYTVTAAPGGATASGLASPITVAGLTNGVSYTFSVSATNSAGTGAASAASSAVTPEQVVVEPEEIDITGSMDNVSLFGTVNISVGAVLTGGSITGTINNNGSIRGNISLGPDTTIQGGVITASITGTVGSPARINSARINNGAVLSNVIIGSGSIVQPGVIIGSNVRFESETRIPAGIELTAALSQQGWTFASELQAVMLDADVLTPGSGAATILQALQSLPEYSLVGGLGQDEVSGEIRVYHPDFRASVVPFRVSQAQADDQPGTRVDDNGDIVLVTANGRVVVSFPVLVNGDAFIQALLGTDLVLSFDNRGNLVATPDASGDTEATAGNMVYAALGADYYLTARPDVLAVPAARSSEPGLNEYSVWGLGSVKNLSLIFTDSEGDLRQQDILPVPADWFALKDSLESIAGVTAVSINERAIIQVTIDGQVVQGMVDYTVVRGTATGQTVITDVGDVTGNGARDFEITYANGDRQMLFVY